MRQVLECIIFGSDDDEKRIVEVPELAGCMTDGTIPQEALAIVEILMEEWIEITKKLVVKFRNIAVDYYMRKQSRLNP